MAKQTIRIKPAEKETIRELADVFISYARTDEAVAANLAQLLKDEGFEVWFDNKIYAGASWQAMLLETLQSAKAVVVIWSKASVKRRWVLKEAEMARRSKRLIPIIIDDCSIPPRFASVQASLMDGWTGTGHHPRLERLLEGIAKLAPPSRIDNVRPGYDSTFLGVEIGLPALVGVAEEFRYLHFSVVMNPARRLPWYVAYNIADHTSVQRGDRWLPDPMLPKAFQPGNEHFLMTGYDRGHLASPLAVSWGTPRQAQLANHQAFFWTNTAPQHPDINRGWWANIEQWERSLVQHYENVVVFAGPVFDPKDPVMTETSQTIGRLTLYQNFLRPQAFWKVVVVKEKDGTLCTAAFYLDQEQLVKSRTPITTPPSYFQSTISHIQAQTGLIFSDVVQSAKQLPV
jgi:DNA/RNA endonuclease G (NUC1)